jgi:hypothetical protein
MVTLYDVRGVRALDRAFERARITLPTNSPMISEEEFILLHSRDDLSDAEEWALFEVAKTRHDTGFASRPGGSGGPPGSPGSSILLSVENTAAGFAKFEQVNNYVKPKVTRNKWLTSREAKKLHELRGYQAKEEQRKSDRDDYDISGSSAPFVRRPPKDPPSA